MVYQRTARIMLLGLVVGVEGSLTRAANIVLHTFTTPPANATGGPIGFAYAGNKFVGTTYNSGLYSTDLNGGNVQLFAPSVHLSGPTVEHFVAASSGFGAFANRDIYIGEGSSIIHVTNDGTSSNTFVSGLNGAVRGIVFDTVGTFGFGMVVTTSAGSVYTVDGTGHAAAFAQVGEDTEGASIVPTNVGFGAFSGQLLVASEGSGNIHAISNLGVVSLVNPGAPIAGAEEVSVVPLNLGASGSPLEGLYGANFDVNVQKADAGQFLGMLGDVIVTGETTHQITRIHFNGASQQFEFSNIGQFPNQPEDGIFVTVAVLNSVPEPSTIILAATAIPLSLGYWWCRRRAKSSETS